MIDGSPAPALQTVPVAAGPDANDASNDDMRTLFAVGQACASGSGAADIARRVTGLIVDACDDVAAAAFYRPEPGGVLATRLARAGTPPSRADPRMELDIGGHWPVARGPAPASTLVVALASTGAPALGWLIIETPAPATEARALFARCAAQSLAFALARADARESERARTEKLARREEAVAVFLADASNQIRTPLTLVLGPLEAAVERHTDTGLKVAWRQAQRLKRLVDTLLDLSLIDSGRIAPVLRPLDAGALTRDVASLFQGAAMASGVRLRVDCPNLPQAIQIDRQQWETIVINLLGNAIKFAPAGVVAISLRLHPGLLTLEVCDTGRGIDPDELPHVFDRFRRVHGEDVGGLGLALVRELVRLHGGDVEATSIPGEGARFRVCIPMLGKPMNAVPHRHVTDLPARPLRTRPADALGWPVPPPARGLVAAPEAALPSIRERIVVVIDHRELREYIAGLLEPHYRVQSLATADEALRAIAEREPDLALIDLAGPAIDGLAFLRRLRSAARGALVPALLVSWDARATAHADAIEAGADDLLGKPFAATELLARVGAHMRLASERRALHRRLSAHNEELEGQVARRTAALAASEAQFKAICNLVPDILWRTDAQGRIEWRSAQWEVLTGDAGMGAGMDFVHPDDRERTQAWVRETVAGLEFAPHEYRLRGVDGLHRWFIARMSPLTAADGTIERWFGSATDIERHQAARHALEVQVHERTAALAQAAGVQQELLHRLSLSQEDERRRIARELHDSLGQYLTALKLALSALAPATTDPHLRILVQRLGALTTEVDRELDAIIAALRPVVLDELGLAGALPGIVADWSRQSGIAAEALLVQVDDERFDDQSESTLYRVTQESLTNIVKHAQARNVAVTLTRHLDELQLTVEDDGIGFDVGQTGGGWGLRGMAERVRSVGGLLQVESTPQAGTTVLVRLPCRPRAASSAGE